ncbi:glycosyltransferase family 2 protein [Prosthecomicrobium pneumaticum]|uniref:Nucleotide-diphospho-sugar transferase domain-containing protein n=1 Tax=Prosthecomicrobium pneumaticum TaxID=81895 RepID=A0A7W9FNF2_9HYPH|nr:hypothetical protein [Prosthecomicrobium pneumaticum]MBB5753919.1 hypothetical protein [Prosthecomicrobium pneumaticum]
MLPDIALRSMRVMFATPCYISAVSMNYVVSVFNLTFHCQHFGLDCILHMHSESLITRARNRIVIPFLEDPSLTHLFWIDSDITFTPQSVFRLLLADRDVVAGVYPMKAFNWPAEGAPAGMTREQFETRYTEFPFNPFLDAKGDPVVGDDPDGLIQVAEAPTGFMCIKRNVFLRMMQHYPNLNYVPDGPPDNPRAPLHWLFFDCMVDPDSGRYLSEDYAFCRRWRDMGGRIFVDPHAQLEHLGQYTYRGNLATHLTARATSAKPPATAT